jgi:arsenate reductase (thioredoxin)
MKKVLILCTGNSCRSQIAEGYLRHFGGDKIEVYSAGIEAHGLNPMAVRVMEEDGIDISSQTSDRVDTYRHISFDYVITVCDHASEHCPVFPGAAIRLHQSFPDPAKIQGSEAEVMKAFNDVAQQIKLFSKELLAMLAK